MSRRTRNSQSREREEVFNNEESEMSPSDDAVANVNKGKTKKKKTKISKKRKSEELTASNEQSRIEVKKNKRSKKERKQASFIEGDQIIRMQLESEQHESMNSDDEQPFLNDSETEGSEEGEIIDENESIPVDFREEQFVGSQETEAEIEECDEIQFNLNAGFEI